MRAQEMRAQEMELASKVGRWARHFPESWQEYQDWLRAIVASRSLLLSRYPVWQAVLIFRWRLVYFVVYVAGAMGWNWLHRLPERLKLLAESHALKVGSFAGGKVMTASDSKSMAAQSISQYRYRYIFQRLATLLAVAELTLCGIAALTGILLAFYYQPAAMAAHESLLAIVNEVAHGTLMLSLHHIAGNGLIVLALVQLVVMFLGREFLLSWFAAWISGILLTLTAMGLSWTAIVLAWEQAGFWRFKVELSTVASMPLVGTVLRDMLSGGGGINSMTLQHMYTLHGYVLAIAALLLSGIHLISLISQEQQWKPVGSRFNVTIGRKRSICHEN